MTSLHPKHIGFAALFVLPAAFIACSSDDDNKGHFLAHTGGNAGASNGSGGKSSGSGGEGGQGGEGTGAGNGSGSGGAIVIGASCDGVMCPQGAHAECVEQNDVAVCRCKAGYTGEDCYDIDECGSPGNCGANTTCTNFDGGYRCDCALGYSGDGASCTDVDECGTADKQACAVETECENLGGFYACGCPEGQFGDGFFCKAEDDCDPNPCGTGACVNTPSGYACQCPLGTGGKNCEAASACDDIQFGDPDVEEAVRARFNIPTGPISSADLVATQLDLPGQGKVTSLAGLECWPTLQALYAADNGITDLSPLTHLTSLRTLDLGCNPVSDLGPLSGLVGLETLYLDAGGLCEHSQSISSIEALEGLGNLTSLYLGQQDVTDLSPLSGHQRLQLLELSGNGIQSVAPLANLTSLESVYLTGNSITNLTPFATLPRLRTLELSSNGISDVAPLADATSLLYLNVSDNELESVSGLSTLDNLAMLNVSYNQLTSAAQFSSMTRLIELNLSSNAITTLEPLVEAQTFGKQGSLWIGGNSLPCASQQEHIDALEARGMTVYGACEN